MGTLNINHDVKHVRCNECEHGTFFSVRTACMECGNGNNFERSGHKRLCRAALIDNRVISKANIITGESPRYLD